MGAKLLIIDDESSIRKFLRVTLEAHGYSVSEAVSGKDGILQSAMVRPDLIILDVGLPDMDGTTVLSQLREWYTNPILVLTVRDDESGKVFALDHGADDYITKPFGMGEFMARIRVALRHMANQPDNPIVTVGPLTVDLAARTVTRDGTSIRLTPIEYDLLKVLVTNAGRVVTHRHLLQQVWGEHSYETTGHYLRIYIGHLRKKIEIDRTRPKFIITEPGVGYRLVAPS
ncbi:response regulator [Alicyclobacillus sp. SO9]|uniref:response regulator n=1 Tax=Alicyclobacillus sp. SO9 TaxID=2665646 RepID=UPI0018E74CB2|nr:response regulator [Alicyclobacillus sp. SO9]QQE77097.1 response regulator [Alicyclobacillus sp. SO9]